MSEPRQILSGSARNGAAGARLVGRTDGAEQVDVTVVLVRKQPIGRDELQGHSLARPRERAIADHATFAALYGASDEAIAAIKALAAKYGLSVTNVDQPRRVVQLSGSASNMEQAFGTVLHNYALGPRNYRGRQGPILLPAEIIPHVEAVLGLDNRPVAKPRFRSRDIQASYYPQQIAALYDFPQGDGTGQTVALIELGGNYGPQDLQTYFAASGLTQTPMVRSVSVAQGVPVPYGQDTVSDGEVMLDIEVVGAIAPEATIVVYFADNSDQGFYQAVSQAVHDPATTAVSISWGSAEKDWSQQTMDAWNTLGQGATLLNVPIFVAAGDHGCSDEQPTDQGYDAQRHADFPGTCADGVVSCGGTSLQSQSGTITAETVWNDGDGWATGGGISTHFQIPTWQNGIVDDSGTALLMRAVPDVAGVADGNTGINVRVNGNNSVSGGTSAVAPQWAALTAILSQRLGRKAGFFLPLLYSNRAADATNDIVSGNNTVYGITGFSAKPGWDACTGIGTPNGGSLLTLLLGTATPVPITNPTVPLPVITAAPTSSQSRTVSPFSPKAAAFYGQFVESAYTMYSTDPKNLTPAPSADFPAGYQLAAWVQMQDFILGSTGPLFYGFIAQSTADANQFILAIRGTSNGIEWWDDANAIVKTPFKIAGCGSVGKGFARIYDTLEVIERGTGGVAGAAVTQSLKPVGGFSQQISALVKRHSAATARTAGIASSAMVYIAGHSLGAALATLYTMENARTDQIQNPLLCTFASPLVGDSIFATAFNALDLTSWRIVNDSDIVPKLPPEILGFTHVDAAQHFSSTGKVKPSVACWHSLATYLSLVDATLQPDADCRLTAAAPSLALAATPVSTALSIPAGPVTVNVTVNVAGND
jgi:kumamolisin